MIQAHLAEEDMNFMEMTATELDYETADDSEIAEYGDPLELLIARESVRSLKAVIIAMKNEPHNLSRFRRSKV